jgi:hypothetical protein
MTGDMGLFIAIVVVDDVMVVVKCVDGDDCDGNEPLQQ